jgi:hypothetical protein
MHCKCDGRLGADGTHRDQAGVGIHDEDAGGLAGLGREGVATAGVVFWVHSLRAGGSDGFGKG